ncbi:hypothetical protein PC129_g19023 [Phytophthora cactorum]|uniref:Reverse transcriptase n=1 Tax=Phytophthora cactorum TaxID=29920 RepID=A0A329RLL6_9STRA|nr:hypothetical protein Pcac1_g4348 [Phytophthora cactorum]KAG2805378.1 hypothetical protein PC112_g18298 [Phytophthora cactorum]KAG2845348.1 hypothetical protein PC113_g18213 [Phytophthora cactorum]KAG2889542.1 hypothetical protein PC115_g19713 [Phytophthora cactorum]KAG2892506.1 hypothetical protein PC114_g16610 [Phytophthora cactorum]
MAAVEGDADASASDTRTRPKGAEPKSTRAAQFAAQPLPALEATGNLVAPLVREFIDIFPDKVPAVLPPDRGVRYDIDFIPGAKYCVTRQWPLPVTKLRQSMNPLKAFDKLAMSARACPHVPVRRSA